MKFSLKTVFYPLLSVISNSEYDKNSQKDIEWYQDWFIDDLDDSQSATICAGLIICTNNGNVTFEPHIKCHINIHIFSKIFIEDWENKTKSEKKAIEIEIRQILTGMVREKIFSLTATSPWGEVVLPPLPIN